jgi:hypothetical protein
VVEKPHGTLVANSRPASAIEIDGQGRGRSPIDKLRLDAGAHAVVFEFGDGRRLEQHFTLDTGAVMRCFALLSAGSVDCKPD